MSTSAESTKWFFKAENAKQGPLSAEELRAKFISRELPVETPVWSNGMETWVAAREVATLFPDGVTGIYSDLSQTPTHKSASKRLLLCGCVGLGFLLLVGQLFLRTGTDSYKYQRISGQVTYEDGQVIPAETLSLTFIPVGPPVIPTRHPRPGFTFVDPKTGKFQSATSRRPGDGIAKGVHKVLIGGQNRQLLPEDVVPVEYADFSTTPLEVDTRAGMFNLTVKRPVSVEKMPQQKPGNAVAR
jgi:hypothetical protein